MQETRTERKIACNNCKKRHVRCGSADPCSNCISLELECVRTTKPFRFKRTSRSKRGFSFATDQTWLVPESGDQLAYVDVTGDIERAVTRDSEAAQVRPRGHDEESPRDQLRSEYGRNNSKQHDTAFATLRLLSSSSSVQDTPHSLSDSSARTIWMEHNGLDELPGPHGSPSSHSHRLVPEESTLILPSVHSRSAVDPSGPDRDEHENPAPEVSSLYRPAPTHPASTDVQSTCLADSPVSSIPPNPLRGLPDGATDESYTNLQEACLIRHFTDNLAQMFDTTDRDRHFQFVVPQRAMFCPVLLYSIYTASARHLTRLWYKRNPKKVVEFDGIPLPGLNSQSAIYYHNVCISYLIEVSNDPTQTYNEDVLTAATILRFQEQIDTSFTGSDTETYLGVVQAVIDSQQDESFYSFERIKGPSKDPNPYESPACSLRHSACLIALRQEIWSVMLYRRPFKLPICPNNDYSQFRAADDYEWANRIFVWCADILRFCFGSEKNNSNKTKAEYWETLKSFERKWDEMRPPSYKPSYFKEPDPEAGRYFPEIWHTNDCQVIGAQHIELGRIFLAVYDPRRPHLGLGARSITHAIESQVRQSTLTLCGLALSNRRWPASLVTAAVGISICGEYFHNYPGEQTAILDFLHRLEDEHAWPTRWVEDALQEAWNASHSRQ